MDIKTIRQAIEMHHKGAPKTDGQIRMIWDSLSPETQKRYIENTKGKNHATNTGAKHDVPIRTGDGQEKAGG